MNINDIEPLEFPTVVTVGNFDGLHRGHTRLVTRAVSLARRRGASSAVVTFEPHTRSVIYPELSTKLLSTFDEKLVLLSKMGVDHVLCVDFDDSFRRLTQDEFVKNILVDRLCASDWVMGEGHHVGQNFGSVKKNLHIVCDKYHINMLTEPLELADGAAISSTRIRGLVVEGRVDEAAALLGHPYLIAAQRTSGVKVATRLGYPTLNFSRPSAGKVIPPAGVYAAVIEFGDTCLQGALYFGDCPTYAGRDTHFEFHALRFDESAREPENGETVHLQLKKFIRPDIAFANERALADQIALDINDINKIF